MAEPVIFVLDGDAPLLEAIVRTVEPLGQVQAGVVWTDLAGPILQLLRDPPRPTVLICGLAGGDGRDANFCRVVRRNVPHARVVIFASSAWGVPDALADVVVSKSAGLAALGRAVALALGPGAQRP